jgi:hypothetical protein
MRTLLHADIFFFLTSIFVVVLTVVLSVAGVYFILILRDMKEISKKVKTEGGEIIEDVKKVREKIEEEGIGLASLGKMFGLFSRKRKK